ncbi:hypothetical protein P7C70_g3451, partial [Phenoliferia sp. Uapishka_3]
MTSASIDVLRTDPKQDQVGSQPAQRNLKKRHAHDASLPSSKSSKKRHHPDSKPVYAPPIGPDDYLLSTRNAHDFTKIRPADPATKVAQKKLKTLAAAPIAGPSSGKVWTHSKGGGKSGESWGVREAVSRIESLKGKGKGKERDMDVDSIGGREVKAKKVLEVIEISDSEEEDEGDPRIAVEKKKEAGWEVWPSEAGQELNIDGQEWEQWPDEAEAEPTQDEEADKKSRKKEKRRIAELTAIGTGARLKDSGRHSKGKGKAVEVESKATPPDMDGSTTSATQSILHQSPPPPPPMKSMSQFFANTLILDGSDEDEEDSGDDSEEESATVVQEILLALKKASH